MSNDNIPDNDEKTEAPKPEGGSIPSSDMMDAPTDAPVEKTEPAAAEDNAADDEASGAVEGGMPPKSDKPPRASKQNLIVNKAIISITPIETREDLEKSINMLSLPTSVGRDNIKYVEENEAAIQKINEYLKQQDKSGSLTDEEIRMALNGIISAAGASLVIDDDYAIRVLEDETAEWRTRKGHLSLKRPTIAKGTSGAKLRGAAAVAHVRTALDMSSAVLIPCLNTGIWINLAACDRWDLTTLVQKIGNEKSHLGTETAGGVFSNSSCYMRRHIVDLIASKIVSHSVKSEDGNKPMDNRKVAEMILVTDYSFIITMINQMVYSKGFEHLYACSNTAAHCTASFKVKLNLAEMVVHDYSRLNEKQDEHMLKAREVGSMTLADIKEYQAYFEYNNHTVVRINERVDFVFKVPSIGESLQEGDRWMSDIKKTIDTIVSHDASEKDINLMIENYIQTTRVRRYTQWIDKILIHEVEALDDGSVVRDTSLEPNYIDERADISSTMVALVDNGESISKLMDHYLDFIAKSSMTMVGSPQFACPKCGAYQGGTETTEAGVIVKAMIPFEAENYFFTLLPELTT